MKIKDNNENGKTKLAGRAREIGALLTSNSLKEAAIKAGISVRTMQRRFDDAAFMQALFNAETRYPEATVARLSNLQSLALDNLEDLLKNEDTPYSVRLGAIRTVMDSQIKLRDLRNSERRIRKLEELMEDIEK